MRYLNTGNPGRWLGFSIGIMAILGLGLEGAWQTVQAQSGVTISPKRIVLEGRKRSAEVTLINRSAEARSYRIFFNNMKMNEDGTFTNIEKPGPGDQFADKMIRYSPREITVPGKSSQSVRLMVRKPSKLPEGEYRSHMVFQALPPPETGGGDIEQQVTGEGQLQIKIVALMSISIPVIIRHGKLASKVTLSDLAIQTSESKPEGRELFIRLNRDGKVSTYGELIATYHRPKGDPLEIGLVRGIAVYVPNQTRTLKLALNLPDGVALKGGNLKVVYRAHSDEGGKVFAESSLAIP